MIGKMSTGCMFVISIVLYSSLFSFMSTFFEFHTSSLTVIVRVHSSEMVVHEVIDFQFSDNSTLQFLLLLSFRDATKISQI
jgi:hypothetical protein